MSLKVMWKWWHLYKIQEQVCSFSPQKPFSLQVTVLLLCLQNNNKTHGGALREMLMLVLISAQQKCLHANLSRYNINGFSMLKFVRYTTEINNKTEVFETVIIFQINVLILLNDRTWKPKASRLLLSEVKMAWSRAALLALLKRHFKDEHILSQSDNEQQTSNR